MYTNPRDLRRIRIQFDTYDQIDERQVGELLILLDRWENGERTPWDTLLEIIHTMGLYPEIMLEYDTRRDSRPGTQAFEKHVELHRQSAYQRQRDIGSEAYRRAEDTYRWLRHAKNDKKFDRAAAAKQKCDELEKLKEKEPSFAGSLKINDDIQGSRHYVDVMQAMIRCRDEAVAAGDDYKKFMAEIAIIDMRVMRRDADHAVEHIEDTVANARASMIAEWESRLTALKEEFRPETLDPQTHEKMIVPDIAAIRAKAMNDGWDSWQIAQAMMEVLLPPESPNRRRLDPPIDNYKRALRDDKKYAESRKAKATEKLFEPITEAQLIQPLAHKYAEMRAYETWRVEQCAAHLAQHGVEAGENDYNQEAFYWAEKPGVPDEKEILPLKAPIDYPDRTLCAEINIHPADTATYGVLPLSRYEINHHVAVDIARVTTYSISFCPKDPADLETLKTVLAEALKCLGDAKHQYIDPETGQIGSYMRVPGHEKEYDMHDHYATSHIDTRDGRVTPQALFDLDDLWLLYLIMQPVIEPNAQIAAALNAARYAEERGTILRSETDEDGYSHKSYEPLDPLTTLKKDEPDMLAAAARDALVDLALNRSDKREWAGRMAVLATHTLTGAMPDIHGAFPTYNHLLIDARAKGTAVLSFEEAVRDRTRTMMRLTVGLPLDSDKPLSAALDGAIMRIAEPIKAERIAEAERQLHEQNERFAQDSFLGRDDDDEDDSMEAFVAEMEETERRIDMAFRLSDVFAGHAGCTPEEAAEARKNALATRSNIAISASRVELALDGLHANNYITRTAGSPLVRYALPEALKPFAQQDHQVNTRLLADIKGLDI